ncbi:MAG: AbrB/MazE/SpoVT family DNA-binding domain-containing protein [Candidatus Tectomicrobia bacterium]|nr:AbrB/MazE/SpoVT family DNA-binding domain-containing protein [Candidatus Tectomicrobia bacterium]
MKVHVSRWGNSLALRIPAPFARELHVEEGSEVDLTVAHGRLLVTPASPRYDLEALVAAITPRNLLDEADWSGPRGHEAW